MTIHNLKLDTKFFDDVKTGLKSFEIRENDRDFKLGDKLMLKRFSRDFFNATTKTFGTYVKKSEDESIDIFQVTEDKADKIMAEITYITDYEQKTNYVVMAIKVIG